MIVLSTPPERHIMDVCFILAIFVFPTRIVITLQVSMILYSINNVMNLKPAYEVFQNIIDKTQKLKE